MTEQCPSCKEDIDEDRRIEVGRLLVDSTYYECPHCERTTEASEWT